MIVLSSELILSILQFMAVRQHENIKNLINWYITQNFCHANIGIQYNQVCKIFW